MRMLLSRSILVLLIAIAICSSAWAHAEVESETAKKSGYNPTKAKRTAQDVWDALLIRIDSDGKHIVYKDYHDGNVYKSQIIGVKVIDPDAANTRLAEFTRNKAVVVVPIGPILTSDGADLRQLLVQEGLAQRDESDAMLGEDQIDEEEEEELDPSVYVNPEYNDPETYGILMMTFLVSMGLIIFAGKKAPGNAADPARVFQKYNRDQPISRSCSTLLALSVTIGIVCWVLLTIYTLYNLM